MHNPDHLGQNIRHYRKKQKLTQAELAERLFISPQNISKWENGLSTPDVSKLCTLADILCVSVDRLLGGAERTGKRVMIGIDGGGTKTELCLFSEQGEVLGRELLPGSNPNIYGMEHTVATLKSGIDALTVRENAISGIFAGIAGCGVESNRRALLSALRKHYPGVRIEVRNDAYNVIYSTPYFDRCIMAIMGTGSVVFAKTEQEFARLGGWGYLFDNGFSGYAIGRDAVMAALAAEDGTGEQTMLLDILKKELGGGIFENVPALYSKPKEEIAAYAKHVFIAFTKGDAVSRTILRERAAVLRHQIECAAAQYDAGTRVILAGGMTRDRDIILSLLDTERYSYVIPTLPPIFGACHYCTRMLGTPPADFAASFEKNYKTIIKE